MDISLPILLVAVFVINVIPAFMPPTWTVLAYFSIISGSAVDPLMLAFLGAVFSTLGRIVLAKWSGPLTYRFLPKKMESNADYAREKLAKHPAAEFIGTFIYALSPLPSNAIFVVSGAAKLRLAPVAAGFFTGRIISYYMTLRVANYLAEAVREALSFGGPLTWLLQLAGVALAIAVFAIDWRKLLQGKKKK